MKNIDIEKHVQGKSIFIDDVLIPVNTLFALVVDSTIAHGNILSVNLDDAKAVDGVKGIFTHKDIPGENQVGGIIQDETLLAIDSVHFIGEPVVLIVAESEAAARKAVKKVNITYEPLPVIIDAREAFSKGQLIMPPKTFSSGNVEDAWKECNTIVEGTVESGGQEHLYLETQGAIAIPQESGKLKSYICNSKSYRSSKNCCKGS